MLNKVSNYQLAEAIYTGVKVPNPKRPCLLLAVQGLPLKERHSDDNKVRILVQFT